MKGRVHREEAGLVLVQLALMMVVLLLFVALAVDMGHIYAERRRMQNAADAGALAGARELCFGSPGLVVARATEYAVGRNGAHAALVGIDVNKVRVVTSETTDTYFAGLIGLSTVDVSAEATAACGQTTRLCTVFPVAFDWSTWNSIPCGSEFYVWDDDSVGDDLCVKCKCEEVIGSAASVGPGDRGWLRLSAPPAPWPNPYGCGFDCGSASLACWIRYDFGGPINIGDCVPGKTGVDTSALVAAVAREGDFLYVLVWGPGPCGPDNTVGECTGDLYHIVSFGYISLEQVNYKLTIPPREGYQQKDCPKNVKVMRVVKYCNPPPAGCGRTDGIPPGGGLPSAVSLID